MPRGSMPSLSAQFSDIADPRVIKHYEIILKINAPVAIAAGWKPGWSTDYCAVTLSQDYGINQVINLTNVDQVYDKDPKTPWTLNRLPLSIGRTIVP